MAGRLAALTAEELLRGLECPVCQEHYRDPRMLQCGHTLCFKPCLEHIVASRQSFKCPECRTEHDVPSGGIDNIPKNVVVSRQLEVRPKTSPSQPKCSNCPICGEEDDLRKCGHCQMLMCFDCVQEHVPLYREQLKEKISDILQKADSLIQDLSTETELEITLRSDFEQILQQINSAEERSTKLIRSKAASLRNDVQSTHQKRVADIISKKKALGDEWIDFASCLRVDEKALCDNDNKLPTTKLRKMAERLSNIPQHTVHDLDAISNHDLMNFVTDFDCLQEAVDKCFTFHEHSNKPVHAPCKEIDETTMATFPAVAVNTLSKDMSKVIHTFTLQLSYPQTVSVDGDTGDVVVADTENHRIVKFDSRGNQILCFGSQGSGTDQFENPCDMLIDNKSRMIVCDTDNHRIKIHNRDGSLHSVLGVIDDGSGLFKDPTGIALDSDGNIHVCDFGNSRMQVITQSGARVSSYDIPGGHSPCKIGITEDGKICILGMNSFSRKHIHILSQRHDPVTSWEVHRRSSAMCVTRDQVLVLDPYSDIIHIYDLRGTVVKVFKPLKVAGNHSTRGLAVDGQGNVYKTCANAVVKF